MSKRKREKERLSNTGREKIGSKRQRDKTKYIDLKVTEIDERR